MSLVRALWLWSLSAAAAAANVTPVLEKDLGVRIEALQYPATLERDLESGLTNRLYLRIALRDGQTVLQLRTVEIAIRYDLWEQTFTVTRIVDETPAETRQLASRAEIGAWLATLQIPRLFVAGSWPANRELTLRVELLLNPISQEKLRMIRKWVAANSNPAIGASQGVSASNTLFNQIFEQYAAGADVASAWRVELVSAPFRPATPADEGR